MSIGFGFGKSIGNSEKNSLKYKNFFDNYPNQNTQKIENPNPISQFVNPWVFWIHLSFYN